MSTISIVTHTEQAASTDEKGRSQERKYPVCVRHRRGKENPGGINSSYRNSSGLVSASVLG